VHLADENCAHKLVVAIAEKRAVCPSATSGDNA